MPTRRIDQDEWFPVYSLIELGSSLEKYYPQVDLTDEEVDQILAAHTAFDKAQEIMRKKFKPPSL